jgi:hypothetical protein
MLDTSHDQDAQIRCDLSQPRPSSLPPCPLPGTPPLPPPPRSRSSVPRRHEFYETDEKIILSVFDRGADPDNVKITYQPRAVRFPESVSPPG